MYREFDATTDFDHMDEVRDGSIHIKHFKIELIEGKIWIRVLRTFTNSNADSIPYWAKMRIYPKEFERLFKEVEAHKDDAQLGLVRYDSGVLGIVAYID